MSTTPTPKPEGFLDSFLNAGSPAGADGRLSDLYEGPKQLLTHPLDSIKMLAGAMADQHDQELGDSAARYDKGDYAGGLMHGVGAALPVAGPLLAKAYDQSAAHNYKGMLGTEAGLLGPGMLMDSVAPKAPLALEHPQIAAQAVSEHAATGGSTFDPLTGKNLAGSKKIAVGIAPEHAAISTTPFTPEQYSNFAATHRDLLSASPDVAVGTHFDPETGLHHMEIVGTTTSKTAARNVAAQMGEDHAYNLATDEKIPSGVAPGAERTASHLSIPNRIEDLASQSPKQVPYSGTHYSDSSLSMIDGNRRGASGGAETARLRLGTQTGLGDDAPGGFYTHPSGTLPDPTMAAKKNVYQVRGRLAFASTDHPEFQNGYSEGVQKATLAGADAQTAHQLGLNAAEKAVQDAGFDGYYSPKHPGTRFHFGSEPAVPVAPKTAPDLDWSKAYGPGKTDFQGNVPAENQGFDFAPAKDYGNAAREDVEKRMGGPLPRGATEKRSALTAAQWPEKYRTAPRTVDATGTAGANYTAADLEALKAKHNITNGSAESSASLEAVNRVAADKAAGKQRLRIDTRSGKATPLFGVDAVDATPGPYDVVIERSPEGDVELGRGARARAVSAK